MLGIHFVLVYFFGFVEFGRFFSFFGCEIKDQVPVIIMLEGVLVIGLLFGGLKVGVAFGVEVTFVGGAVERVRINGLGLFVVNVVELGFKTEFLLQFLQVLQEATVLGVHVVRFLLVFLIIDDRVGISIAGLGSVRANGRLVVFL